MRIHKTGFTLVELLVVIAIIGILIGMLLPAVQQVREAARRSSCSNNQKQLALGALNYESSYGGFPPGYSDHLPANLGGPTGGAGKPWNQHADYGWAAKLLPFLELNNAYDTLDFADGQLDVMCAACAGVGGSAPITDYPAAYQDFVRATSQKYPVFECPSGIDTSLLTSFKGYKRDEGVGRSNYVGCQGNGFRGGALEFDDGGVFVHWKELKIAEIYDGTSNTIMLGERGSSESVWDKVSWLGLEKCVGNGAQGKIVVGTTRYAINPLPTDRGSSVFSFGSQHAGGAVFAFADGSIHFLSETIEFKYSRNNWDLWGTYQKLGHREDGLVLGDY